MSKTDLVKVQLFVASPGDVPEERQAVKEVIGEIEATIAPSLGIHIQPFHWEYDLDPGAHPDGPQGWVDAKSNLATCDIIVGIFYNRIGTPTKDGKTGTQHEIEVSFERWQKTQSPHMMLYFSNRPVEQTRESFRQGTMLLEFKQSLPKEILYREYDSAPHFTKLFRQHLTQHLMRLWRERGQPADRIRFTSDAKLGLVLTAQDVIQTNADIVTEAEEFFFATGSRGRDEGYLRAIEARLKQQPKLIHHRVLMGPPFRQLLKEHLLRLLELRPPEDRSFGFQTLFMGLFEKPLQQAEVFMAGNEKRALIVLPSRQDLGGYNTALVVDERSYVHDWHNFVKQMFAASKPLHTPAAIQELPTALG